jgi:hypothetical protein
MNLFIHTLQYCTEAKSKVSDWGDQVDYGIELLMVNVLELTLEGP